MTLNIFSSLSGSITVAITANKYTWADDSEALNVGLLSFCPTWWILIVLSVLVSTQHSLFIYAYTHIPVYRLHHLYLGYVKHSL